MFPFRSACRVAAGLGLLLAWNTVSLGNEPQVQPAKIHLQGDFQRMQLLVRESAESDAADLTHRAKFVSGDEKILQVIGPGLVLGVGNGETHLTVEVNGKSQKLPVQVEAVAQPPKVGFSSHIVPILSKAGCNAGACHASQHGKGGFKLSVFAFDPKADHEMIVRNRRGRRVNLLEPQRSLVLLKPSLGVPHGGGKRLDPNSVDYEILSAWLSSGVPAPSSKDTEITKLEVYPQSRVAQLDEQQQLRVVATDSEGNTQDVTTWAQFDSLNEGVATLTEAGLVSTVGKGQAPIMIRFRGQAAVAMMVVPYQEAFELSGWQSNNVIDDLAAMKFKELGLEPSGLCDDATFLRRAYLDAIGTLPTPERAEQFLDSQDPHKREKLIDELLGLTGDPERDVHNNAWAAHWALRWADLLRCNSKDLGDQGMWALYNWIKESMRTNRGMDEFAQELITAQGSIYMNGPANYFRIATNPNDLAEATAQTFLGVRMQCAKCHHHPFEKYGQEDYYGLAAFFARVGTKNSEEFGIFGRESVVLVKSSGEVRHPKTGQNMEPTPLEGEPTDDPLDRRRALAKWIADQENPFFAKNIANRYWKYLMGTGLVEPVDDMRATNPPSNPELLDALALHFADSGYDAKQLVRLIMNSRLYQLDYRPTEANAKDTRFYSHYQVKRLSAEPLLDAIDAVTASPTKFKNLPLGTRAIELPDAEYPNYFLQTFGKPRREIVCECERMPEPNLAQSLHVLNGKTISQKINDKNGRLAKLLKGERKPQEIITAIYLAALSRRPTPTELQTWEQMAAEAPDTQEFYEDLMWTVLNSKQFLFIH